MSKVKISISLLVTILLVGILNVVAFAAGPQLNPAPKLRFETDYENHKLIVNWGQVVKPTDSGGNTYSATTGYNVYIDNNAAVNITDVAGLYLYKHEIPYTNAFQEYAIRVGTVSANGEKKTTLAKVIPAQAPEFTNWTSAAGQYSVTWDAVPDATGYKVVVDGVEKPVQTSTTYSDTNATNNERHEIEVIATNGTLETQAAVIEISAGGPQYNQPLLNTLVSTDDANDNGIINANKTGVGVGGDGGQNGAFDTVIKSTGMKFNDKTIASGTHRTHGEYQNNTNSCASCHQTHTAASKNLLFKNGVYATCTACHDGTLGFYNVYATGANASKSTGTFGGTESGNMSVHMATGAVSIKAAPGGNKNGKGSWGGEFTCASCHAPHGSYSDRLLHFNPNGMGETPVADGGLKLEDMTVYNDGSQPTTHLSTTVDGKKVYQDNILVKKTLVAADVASGALYDSTKTGLVSGDIVIQMWKWSDEVVNADGSITAEGYVVADKTPWLYGYEFSADHSYRTYWSSLYDYPENTNRDNFFKEGSKEQADAHLFNASTNKYLYVWKDGYAAYRKVSGIALLDAAVLKGDILAADKTKATTAAAKFETVDHADISRAYVVKLEKDPNGQINKGGFTVFNTAAPALWGKYNVLNTTTNSWVTLDKSSEGPKMSAFCATCHTDYLANSGSKSGTFDHAYRHTTTSASYTCVRCHFSHGTDVTIMKDSQGRTINDLTAGGWSTAEATSYMMDKSTDSALKRFTNMSVCWGCHTSSHSEGFRNNDYYKYGTSTSDATMGLTNGQ